MCHNQKERAMQEIIRVVAIRKVQLDGAFIPAGWVGQVKVDMAGEWYALAMNRELYIPPLQRRQLREV